MFFQVIRLLPVVICVCAQAQQHDEEVTTNPHPYSFAFTAGRYPGNIDRTRAEYGDDNGIIRGLYTYVDPRHEIRAVEYTADKNGFHPVLNVPAARDTPAVSAERSRHLKLFNEIARNKNRITVPAETQSVAEAKRKHALLYAQIAAEHAKIAAILEAARAESERQEFYKKSAGAT